MRFLSPPFSFPLARYAFDLPPLSLAPTTEGAGVQDALLIGRCTVDGYWIKAKITGGDSYLLAKTEGHRVSYRTVPGSTLRTTATLSDM